MKKTTLFILLSSFIQIASAQKPGTSLSDLSLKGKVKQVVEYAWRGDKNADTLGSPEKSIMNFDELGNQTNEFIYSKNGQIESKFLFDYTKKNIVVKDQYQGDGGLIFKYTFAYDAKGNEVEFDTRSDYSPMIKIDAKVFYKYDAADNRVAEETHGEGGELTERAIFIYNAKNQKVQATQTLYYGKTKTVEVIKYTYDQMDNILTMEAFGLDGKLKSKYNSSYNAIDGMGNWTIEILEDSGYNKGQGNYLFKTVTKRYVSYY